MLVSFKSTAISAIFLSLPIAAVAQAADEKTETVYVSATRGEGPQMPVATQITIVNEEQIRLSGATTVTEVLRTQAGIQIIDDDGSGGRNVAVAMEGFTATAGNNTLVLVDGRKLNNPTLAGPALNTVSLKDIERIEIIQGSAGVLYGDQAVGGVINIITREAKAGEFNGSVNAEAVTGNLENYTANISQGFANGLSYKINAQKRNADNYRDNNQSEISNLLGNIAYNFDAGKVFVEQQLVKDDLRLPGSISERDAAINPRLTYSPNDSTHQETDLKRVGGIFEFTQAWKILGEYSDRDETGNYFYDDYYTADGYFPYASAYELRVKTLTPRLIGSFATAQGDSVVTLGYDRSDADYATKDGFTNITQKIDGVYGQIIYPVVKDLSVTAGARHARVEDTNHHAYDSSFNLISKTNNESLNATEIGLNYQVNSAWRVFARLADGFRFATADENAFTLSSVSFLDPQKTKSQEAGVTWTEKTASVKYSVYHMDLDDEITYDAIVPNSGSYNGRGANINLPQSERQGFIFDGNLVLSEQISVRGNYTYTDTELSSGSYKGKEVPFVAKETANMAVVFTVLPQVTVTFDANYTGKRFHVDDYANAAARIPAVTLFNLNLLWELQGLELGFKIKNITNERYADYNSIYGLYPQPERAYAGHISYTF